MTRVYFSIAGAALLLSALPALAQHHGGGHAGGHPGGGHAGGVHTGGYSGARPGTVQFGGYSGYRGATTGGIYLNLGLGLSNSYGGGNYYRPNYSQSVPSYYGSVPSFVAPVVSSPQQNTSPELINPATNPTITRPDAVNNAIPLGVESGLRITDLYEGTAKTGGLRKGDILLKVNGVRTQSFEELRAALSAAGEKAQVEFIDSTSGETEKKSIGVDGGKIGVSVSEVAIPKT